ncbi:MAG TPA: hypothetical protein VLP43_00865 [Solirubrobacteraceae bacterium]|nr:hypothetical protein [Solirubrobacteraceae bacterium]
MQQAFGTVLWVVCGIGIVLAFVSLALSGKTWSEFGRSTLMMDRHDGGPRPASAAALAERDTEIRQMLEARNSRRARRGESPLDIEAELARLTAPSIDDELRQEIRDLVVARNYRRARKGQAPLDVETEVAREIASLTS